MALVIDRAYITPAISARLRGFLARANLNWDGAPERAYLALDGDVLAGMGALDGRVIKYVAVDDAYTGTGLAARIVSLIISEAYALGRSHLFLFTAPANIAAFERLGFSLVASAREAALMETGDTRVDDYARALAQADMPRVQNAGALVLNANPFTLGHAHILGVAASGVERLNVFVVGEHESAFPYAARLDMVRRAARGYHNVRVHETSDYVLSSATFPAYFLKDASRAARAQARLDAAVFAERIAPALSVTARFFGEEPLCAATRAYNEEMADVLPARGVSVRVIERLSVNGEAVSASQVRALISRGDMQAARALLPASTLEYLDSDAGRRIISRLTRMSEGERS